VDPGRCITGEPLISPTRCLTKPITVLPSPWAGAGVAPPSAARAVRSFGGSGGVGPARARTVSPPRPVERREKGEREQEGRTWRAKARVVAPSDPTQIVVFRRG